MTTPPAGAGPQRIQRKRTKGWKMPANTIYVGRPTEFGNPYPLECFDGDRGRVVGIYRRYLLETPLGMELLVRAKETLRGKNLACWCRLDQACHADVLLDLANGGSPSWINPRLTTREKESL